MKGQCALVLWLADRYAADQHEPSERDLPTGNATRRSRGEKSRSDAFFGAAPRATPGAL